MKRMLLALLCTIMLASVCLAQSAVASVGFRTTLLTTPQVGGCVITLKEAGIQYLVPPGWEVEMGKDGSVTFSKKDGNSFFVATISLLSPDSAALSPETQFQAVSEGAYSEAKKHYQDFKLGAAQKNTLNRMPVTIQNYSAKLQGVDVTGAFALVQANKPVIIFTQVSTKASQTSIEEFSKLMGSAKKIE